MSADTMHTIGMALGFATLVVAVILVARFIL